MPARSLREAQLNRLVDERVIRRGRGISRRRPITAVPGHPGGYAAGIMLLRLPRVIEMTGLSRSTIYIRIKQGSFPRSVSLGPRSVAWVRDEVEAWIRERIAASRGAPER